MPFEFSAYPLAFLAGVMGIISPCVWPLVPVVMGSANSASRHGAVALALGLSVAFAAAGSVLSFLLVNAGLDPELFRYVAASLLLLAGAVLVHAPLGEWVGNRLSLLSSRLNTESDGRWLGQFGIGLLLGIVWLPCVGPTLGAAIALASMGQRMSAAFLIMLCFGLGTTGVLLLAARLSTAVLARLRGPVVERANQGKLALGWIMLLLGALVLTGLDKILQTLTLAWMPEWSVI